MLLLLLLLGAACVTEGFVGLSARLLVCNHPVAPMAGQEGPDPPESGVLCCAVLLLVLCKDSEAVPRAAAFCGLGAAC
jgi:hypothetical protein